MAFIFPTHELRIKTEEDQEWVWDPLRKKWLVFTPEEEVRQQLVEHLLIDRKIKPALIGIEKEIAYNQLRKRLDVVIYDSEANPWLLCECKAPSVKLSQETLHQIARYNAVLRAPHLLLTNGLNWLLFSLEKGKYVHKPAGWPEPKN